MTPKKEPPVPPQGALTRPRRRALRLFLGVLVVAWTLLSWRGLAPPIPVTCRDAEVHDLVWCAGGEVPSPFTGGVERISAFWIERFEVTAEDYANFLAAHPQQPAPPIPGWKGKREPPIAERDLPVTHVSLLDARAYAAWRGRRLPTALEWELAARGGTSQRFPWGDSEPTTLVANSLDAGFGRPTPVGLFESGKSPVGAYDMVGNVDEWTDTRAPGILSDRYFTRGGSFREPIIDRSNKVSVMDTHAESAAWPSDVEGGLRARSERLRGPNGYSSELGFRCVRDVADVDRENSIRRSARKLGVRDPVGWLFEYRRARAALLDAGPFAVPVLEEVAGGTEPGLVKERATELLERIRRDVAP